MSSIPRRAAGVLAVLAVAVVIAAPKLLDLRRTSSAPGGASMTETALQVRAYRVEPTELTEQLSTTGTIRANEEVEIVSEI
ncbi:MAG: hypothetical protein P8127_01750, partial [Acidobacteriota bacterium]